ncbi:MAG TPA: hypothetical protein DCL78_12850, partial [Gammaproteobacteria bacterium]|nr:hypothetical protein [Gammaproteobacteria bacterium]
TDTCAPAAGTYTINGVQVVVNCSSLDYNEAGNTTRVFQVDVRAQSGGAPSDLDFVSRQLTVVLNVEL